MPQPAPPKSRFEITRLVGPDALDERDHVNNVVYLQWVQDVAVAHWSGIASADAQATVAWVAMRHEIDYLYPAVLGDEILIRTWVGPTERLLFERHTEVYRARDARVLARARTLWCPVDAVSGRPRRVPAEVRAEFSMPAPDDRPRGGA